MSIITPIEILHDPIFDRKQISIHVKRLDKVHKYISGNKWYKLKYNLKEAREQSYNTLLTFGGAYSNHIYAVAAAGKEFGFKTIGLIRGEEHTTLNPTLNFTAEMGMDIYYVDRGKYRDKDSEIFLSGLRNEFGEFYLLPEGGTNPLAVKGCKEIVDEIDTEFDYIILPVGTGGTLAGIISGIKKDQAAIGFSSLKGKDFLEVKVNELLKICNIKPRNNWQINYDYSFGGYAKINNELLNFIKSFEDKHKIEIEPVYTGKMFYGLYDLVLKDFFPKGSKIIALHTGGLQGLKGFEKHLN